MVNILVAWISNYILKIQYNSTRLNTNISGDITFPYFENFGHVRTSLARSRSTNTMTQFWFPWISNYMKTINKITQKLKIRIN